MTLESLQRTATEHLLTCPENHVTAEDALRPDLAGMPFYDEPLFGVASADDPLFFRYKNEGIVHEEMLLPDDWLPGAKSIISFFLPFSEPVRVSNRKMTDLASDEWFHARIEGQMMMDHFGKYVCQLLEKEGYRAVYPAADPRFHWIGNSASNWSERHAAYAAGLGTFGLSKGLITKKGMAGRFGSVITDAILPATEREYSNPFEYCIMCGKCQIMCPAGAIDINRGILEGKNHSDCQLFQRARRQPPHGPNQRIRYGCGKCQVNVPCETCIPKRTQKSE